MTRKVFLDKLKGRFFIILALACILCFSAFTLIACGGDDSSFKEPTYTKTENDEQLVANGNFEFGSYSLDIDDYPQTSISGWSVGTDNSAYSSSVNSGIVDTENWDTLMKTFYDDNDFKAYLLKSIKQKDTTFEEEGKSKDDILAKAKELEIFLNPAPADNGKILMINNYRTSNYFGFGTAQKATMSNYVSMERGSFGKFSITLKTENLVVSGKGGANIRLMPSINSSTQKDFSIYGINTNGEWKTYTIYVKADADFDTKAKLALGLGFGNGASDMAQDYTEGTVYFDNVIFEEVDEIPDGVVPVDFSYGAEEDIKQEVGALDTFAYSISVEDSYFANQTKLDLTTIDAIAYGYNAIAGKTSQDVLGTGDKGTLASDANSISISNVDKASAAFTLSDDSFVLGKEEYKIITFKYQNKLGRFDKSGITVYVNDIKANTFTSALTITEQTENDEWKRAFILVKNNFAEKDANGDYAKANELTFSLKFIVGPTDLTSKNANDYATGNVYFKDFYLLSGKTYQYVRNTYKDSDGNDTTVANNNVASYFKTADETAEYKFYTLFSSKATTPVSLLGNYSSATSTTANAYAFSVAPSDLGKITSAPANVKDYTGVDANHIYIKDGGTAEINNNKNGSAGLINTKYMSAYGVDVENALAHNVDKDIQPLMIYNSAPSSYGFVGSSITISPSAFATISVKVRVTGDAKAYVYLADISGTEKTVLDFKVAPNASKEYGDKYIDAQPEIINKLAFEGITADMMETDGENKGWLVLTFYIATGAQSKTIRLEMWNGSRDGSNNGKSSGYVFFDNVGITNATAFVEPASWQETFSSSESVLYGHNVKDPSLEDNAILYKRVLDEAEIEYNEKQTDEDNIVSYASKYVWAKNKSTIYAIYNTIEPVATDPNLNSETDTDAEGSGCLAETDPSAFWLSFSSILLGVVLVLAIIALIVKRARRKRKANASDAKSHYNVSSRIKAHKEISKKKKLEKLMEAEESLEKDEFDEFEEEPKQETEEVETETTAEDTKKQTEEPTLDEYVYGDVQDFGDDIANDSENKNE